MFITVSVQLDDDVSIIFQVAVPLTHVRGYGGKGECSICGDTTMKVYFSLVIYQLKPFSVSLALQSAFQMN